MAKIEVLPPAQSKATEPMRPATEANAPPAQVETIEPARSATEAGVPVFTLRASNPFHIRAMIKITQNAQALGCPREELGNLDNTMRAFEFWEEAHRK